MLLDIKKTRYRNHPVELAKALNVEGTYYGIKPQYQRAEIIIGGDCETVGDFVDELTGSFARSAFGSGRVGSNAIKLLQTTAASNRSIRMLLATAVDLSWANYVGFWYQGGNDDAFTAGDIRFYIFTRPSDLLYAQRACTLTAIPTFTEKATAVWKYREIRITDMVFRSGYSIEDLKNVWGIGFYSDAGTDTNFLVVDQIEFYTHPTGYGPARGTIVSASLKDGVYVKTGWGVAWDPTSGRIQVAANNEVNFAGIVCEADNNLTEFPTAGDVEFRVADPSRLETGTARLWDSNYAEDVTITDVDYATGIVTVSSIANTFTAAANAKIAMYGNEEGGPTTTFVKDGPANMLCSAALITTGEGVSLSNTGDTMTIDDGGASSQGVMMGRSSETGALGRVIVINLRVAGTTGA